MAKKKPAPKKISAQKAAQSSAATKKSPKPDAAKGKSDLESVRTKLQALLEKPGTEAKIVKLLLPLDEDQRRELSPMCQKSYREVKKNEWIEDPPGTHSVNALLPVATTAVFCTGNVTEIQKLGWRIPNDDVILEVLTVRKPNWVERFVELLLSQKHYWFRWRLCREFVRRGLCPKPDDPRYHTGMITGLIDRSNRGERTALDSLRDDPGLLKDEVWRLFEYEGEADNTLANVDRWEASNWSGALVTLSKEGELPRGKLLDSALGALELGFNHYRARWFLNFFDRMEPTDQELKKRSATILGLIGNAAPNVAQWAFEKQQLMLDRGLIQVSPDVVRANAPLMGGRHKKTVLQTLALFDQIAQTSSDVAREVCRTTAQSLGHEKADVQKAALKIIEKHGSCDDRELHETVGKYASVASATVKKQLGTWLASGAEETAKLTNKNGTKPAILDANLKKFDARHVKLLSLEPLVAAFENTPTVTTPIPAAVFDGTDFARLDPVRKITPISDVDELLEVLGQVIENESLIDEAEQAIDGLTRLHADKPEDFDKRIGPIEKRAAKLLQEGRHSPFSGQGVVGNLCGLIVAWKRGKPVTTEVTKDQWGQETLHISGLFDEPMTTWHLSSVPLAFMSERMLNVCEIVTSNQPRQLLSAPTHEGGWIDAATLVERINRLEIEPPETDVVLALLRLAPDGRASALKSLKPSLKGEWIDAIKHGLGADRIRIGKTAALWAAAARCCSPLQDDPKVAKAFPKLGPGAGKAARFEIGFRQEQTQYSLVRHITISTSEKMPKDVPTNIPSQLMQRNRHDGTSLSFQDIGTSAGDIQWLATLWPAAFESFFATGAECIGENLDWWEAQWHNRCFLEPLLNADIPLLDMGEILLLCGLAAKEPGEHGLAVDIAIQAISDGRLGTDNMSHMLTTAITSGHFNLPRLAKRLQDVANVSDLHAYVVVHSTETAVPRAHPKPLPRGIGDLFELLAEISTQLERGIENLDCRSFLESITGSNKAAKAAKQLLSIKTHFDPQEIIASAVTNRMDRLKKWSERS